MPGWPRRWPRSGPAAAWMRWTAGWPPPAPRTSGRARRWPRRLRRYPGVAERHHAAGARLRVRLPGDRAQAARSSPSPASTPRRPGCARWSPGRRRSRYGPPARRTRHGGLRADRPRARRHRGTRVPRLLPDRARHRQVLRAGRHLVPGTRVSAANSAVCYALGITSVDPVRHGLLFERFLSAGRDGPPDIDLDIEHQRREEVIQYVYGKYGRDKAAQVANVIAYRPRMALRDAGRALGYTPQQQDSWAKQVGPRHYAAGQPVPADAGVPEPVTELADRMQRLPRHLGIHSGGMVICDRPVGEVCPVEWARMPGRTRAAVGQGGLRLRRAGQVRPARPGHADGAAGLLRARGGPSRRQLGPAHDPAGGRRRLRHAVRGGHRRGVPGRVAGPDGDAAAAAAPEVLRPGGGGRADQAGPDPGRLGAPVHAPAPRRRAARTCRTSPCARPWARPSGSRCSRSR